MAISSRTGRTLALTVPAHCEDAVPATEKWLLALWQACRKRTWRLWRNQATISLELRAAGGSVNYQVHFSYCLLAVVSEALLQSHFPGGEITEVEEQEALELGADASASLVTFTLRSPGWVDLPKVTAPEGVLGLLAVMSRSAFHAPSLVQLLLEPTWLTTEDGRQPAFWFVGRIVAVGNSEHDAKSRAQLIGAALGQFSGFNGLHCSKPRRLRSSHIPAITERRWPRRLLPPGQPATAAQIAMLYHPPANALPLGYLRRATCLKLPVPFSAEGIALGEGLEPRGRSCQVRLASEDLLRHALVVGPSGSGKTTFLAHLACELILAKQGVTVIDPHGGLVRQIARSLPVERRQRAFLFRLSDTDYPISLNPLTPRRGQEFLVADEFVEVVQRVYGREYWGPLLDLALRHAALAAMELGGSPTEIARLLDDAWFRDQVAGRLANAETARFLGRLGDKGDHDRRFLPAVHRVQRLLATPWLRNLLGQPGRALDFSELFGSGAVALFDLSGIGTTNAKLLGSLLLLLIRQAALARGLDAEAGPRHLVLVDEASWFVSRTVAELLDQARKFGVGLVLAVQRLGQLSPAEVREAVLANAANLLAFRLHDREEAATMARHFASERLGPSDLQHLPRYEAYVQLTRDGERLEPAWLRAPAPASEPAGGSLVEAQLLLAARRRYARPRAEVEAELRARERRLYDDAEPEIRSLQGPPREVLTDPARSPHP